MIDSKVVAHMVGQIRGKQRAIEAAQDYLKGAVIDSFEEYNGKFEGEIFSELLTRIEDYSTILSSAASQISNGKQEQVGFPINNNKTSIQLSMVRDWVAMRRESLISDIDDGKLYNGLSNNVLDTLPQLGADNTKSFWGNENPSVSTMMLYTAAYSLGADVDTNLSRLAGAATLYPFFDTKYTIDVKVNPFLSERSMLLFGDYQFGGHRYFSKSEHKLGQKVFGPEDCSSAVGKALGLKEDQIVGIWTGALRESYSNPDNEYGLKPVTTSNEGQQINIDAIQAGDIFVRGGHTAVIYNKDQEGNIFTLDFNRDLERESGKMLGGGTYQYNLLSASANSIYILRPSVKPLHESSSMKDIISKIDNNFANRYVELLSNDRGDCSIFL